MTIKPPIETYHKLLDNLEKVITGQKVTIRKLLAAFVSGGHVLLEDLPGTGKTTLAKAFAYSLDLDFHRIQFTPDLLPSDILGVSIFNPELQKFEFHKGPIFTEILLADEINRASPRVQSALLEAMAEKQVSMDNKQYNLQELFFVVATQNPVEYQGTYALPEAQLDRFALKFSLGYVDLEDEINILTNQQLEHPLRDIRPCVGKLDVRELRQAARNIRVSDEIKRYIVELVRGTRTLEGIQIGASPRAALTLMSMAQALALFDDMEFVLPEHIQEIAVAVIAHRLKVDSQAYFSGVTAEKLVEDLLRQLPVPV